MTIELRAGALTNDPRLDRLPQFDEKSRDFPVRKLTVAGAPVTTKKPRSYTWAVSKSLDQYAEGRCVEFSICHDLLARPKVVPRPLVDEILAGKRIYWPAQRADSWPGGSYPEADPHYEGTSVLAGIKAAADLGFYREYSWAFTLEEAILALGYFGPLVLGVNWYTGMRDTDVKGWIHPTGEVEGGHAILANSIKIIGLTTGKSAATFADIDLDRSYIVLWNSWGPNWGTNGRAKLSLADFDRLRQEDGEVCVVNRRIIPKALPAAA